jgi:hypothetical protein
MLLPPMLARMEPPAHPVVKAFGSVGQAVVWTMEVFSLFKWFSRNDPEVATAHRAILDFGKTFLGGGGESDGD